MSTENIPSLEAQAILDKVAQLLVLEGISVRDALWEAYDLGFCAGKVAGAQYIVDSTRALPR